MAFSRLVFTVLFLSVSCYATKVPVYLWGDLVETSTKANPLLATTTSEFNSILKEELAKDPFVVVFSDETLSVEDFSRTNPDGESSFPYLHAQLSQSRYLPSVLSPLQAFSDLADTEKVQKLELTEDGLSAEIDSSSTFIFIDLKDAKEGESRAEMLRRHNDFMEQTFTELKKVHENVIALYTGHYPSWVFPDSHSRVRRQAESNDTSDDYMFDGLRLYAYRIGIREGNNTIHLNGNPISRTELNATGPVQTMNTTLTFGENSFAMNFRQEAGYWYFDSITLNPGTANVELFPELDLFSITGFSYRCGQEVVFSAPNVTQTLVLSNMQVQPFFRSTNESIAFGDSFDCVGFFTAPIWSGIFVTFILLAITFYGIMMMMDIRTMDRFDDPKGKTITINTLD